VSAFIDALTKGGPGGNPRPMEMHADDPKRYVGDMLAWLHQTIPSEKDAIHNLLRQCTKTGAFFFLVSKVENIVPEYMKEQLILISKTIKTIPF